MGEYPAILYVEDDAMSRRVMKLLLVGSMNLVNVTILENSTNFMDRVQEMSPQPDIILLDIHMDPYDGFQMLQMLKSSGQYNDIPIVALTASVMSEEIQQLQDAGFTGCIGKPIDADQFPILLDGILNGKVIWNIIN